MRTIRSFVIYPGAALAGLVALAAWPVVRAGYPSIGDGLIHFYRLVEFDHLLRQGVWFPRWATDLGYGYGYPVFNFYPPLTYYLGAFFHALGFSFAHSLLGVYVLALALAVTGAYALAHERWGQAGGLVAASAYGLSPYLYFNILARGALPETVGLGLLPWVLWAFYRLTQRPGAGHLLAATLLYAGLWLTHLLSAVLAAPLIVVFVLMAGLNRSAGPAQSVNEQFGAAVAPRRARSFLVSRFWLPLSAFCLSLLVSAFFLLPALFETSYVQIQQLTLPGDLDFHNNFLSLATLFALPHPFDARLVFIAVPPSLSLAALGLALLGLAFSLLRRSRFGASRDALALGPWELGIGASLLLFCLFTLPLTTPLWEKLPLANILQFPWRLVGPASLLLALLAARNFGFWMSDFRLGRWNFRIGELGVGISIALLFFYSLAWSFAPAFVTPASPTLRDLAVYESSAGQLGTTSTGEFLPRDVHALPLPDSLQPLYARQDLIDRLAALPPGVTLVSQASKPTLAEAVVEAQAPAFLTFNFFYFPGWRATVDGKPAPIRLSYPYGLITVPIESGRHSVTVQFGATPLRALAAWLSVLGLLALLVISFWILGFGFSISRSILTSSIQRVALSPCHRVTLSVFALLLIRFAFIDGRNTPFARSRFDGATVSGVGQALDVNFDNQLVLIGLDRPQAAMPADGALPLTLYWRAQNPPAADYSASVQVMDETGNLFGQSDSQNPGRLPTSRWELDQYAQDEHRLALLPGTPPGVYRLMASVYQFRGTSLDMLDENQVPQGQAYALGTLTVTRAQKPPAEINAGQRLHLALGPLTLVGQTLDTTSPQAGDEFGLTLFWQAGAGPRPDLELLLELISPEGRVIQSLATPPARSDYLTSAWTPGEIVRAPLRLPIPASAPPGMATLQASLVAGDGARVAGPQALAAIDLRVPNRSFVVPAISHPRADEFGGKVELLGYDLAADQLTLYWQALAEMNTSYAVFVHALDANDHILAQVDAVPVNGTRPTTGWLPGEVIADAHSLPLAGAAQIEVGLYDKQTGERLGTLTLMP